MKIIKFKTPFIIIYSYQKIFKINYMKFRSIIIVNKQYFLWIKQIFIKKFTINLKKWWIKWY